MTYKILADLLVLIHFFWILFLVFGLCLGIRYWIAKVLHLIGLAFAFVIQIFDWSCPLTYLEVWLRARHDPALAYRGSFIVHYIEKIVYIQLSRLLIIILTTILFGLTLWVYFGQRQRMRDK